MAGGERRNRRVRHEAGGDSGAPSSTQSSANQAPPQKQNGTKPPPNKGGKGKGPRGGVQVATVDESKFYQPVTIMESKKKDEEETEGDEIEQEPKKYRKRGIVSNWSRYEPTEFLEDVDDGSDYLLGEDFSSVIEKQLKNKGSHLRLKGEEDWSFTGSSVKETLGDLKVGELVQSLRTISLMEQMMMEAADITPELSDYYKEMAEANRKNYKVSAPKPTVDTAELIADHTEKLKAMLIDDRKEEMVDILAENDFYEEIEKDISNSKEDKEHEKVDLTNKFSELFSRSNVDDDKPDSLENKVPDLDFSKSTATESFDFGLPKLNTDFEATDLASMRQKNLTDEDVFLPPPLETKKNSYEPDIDLDAPVVMKQEAPLVKTEEETKELEDWLDSVLDD